MCKECGCGGEHTHESHGHGMDVHVPVLDANDRLAERNRGFFAAKNLLVINVFSSPGSGDYLSTGAAHTLEHLFATYARNSAFQDSVIYVGPMGCRTGFYLLTRGLTPAEALELTVESFRFMAGFEGAVPGASEVECGNYRDMDLPAAKAEAAAMLPVLEALTGDELHY